MREMRAFLAGRGSSEGFLLQGRRLGLRRSTC